MQYVAAHPWWTLVYLLVIAAAIRHPVRIKINRAKQSDNEEAKP